VIFERGWKLMAEFLGIIKRVDLSYLGPEYKETYLRFYGLTVADLDEIGSIGTYEGGVAETKKIVEDTKKLIEVLKKKFVDGKVLDPGMALVDLKAEDLGKLPVEILMKVMETLSGGPDLKGN